MMKCIDERSCTPSQFELPTSTKVHIATVESHPFPDDYGGVFETCSAFEYRHADFCFTCMSHQGIVIVNSAVVREETINGGLSFETCVY
jgi:hypothetical protein